MNRQRLSIIALLSFVAALAIACSGAAPAARPITGLTNGEAADRSSNGEQPGDVNDGTQLER